MPIDSKPGEDQKLKAEMERTVYCYNYSNRDYAHPDLGGTDTGAAWGKQPLALKAQERKRMPFYLARHIAIGLAQREIAATPEYRKKERTPQEIRVTSTMIENEMRKCISEIGSTDRPQASSSVMELLNNLNEEEVIEKKPVKKLGRPKKSEPIKEEEFVGLKT